MKITGLSGFFAAVSLALATLSGCSTEQKREQEAMDFLYKYMSIADKGDYTEDFFRSNVRTALRARSEMPWGGQLTDDLFNHFVLPVRVNNERLDDFRMTYYDTLKARTAGMSMHDAALEINHWCHEKVTYIPSDARTSSPLASILNGEGRCGEESTFTVAAMRTAGIPARQVYTPRWAHTDDNHAWVEVWTDGKWSFLGACEPEPELNMAWFNEPASRAMLMHTLVFGDYNGSEDVIRRTCNFTEINVIPNYVRTRNNVVKVIDSEGNPVQGARVEFCIYNYAEMYPAVALTSDGGGQASIHTGIGDMFVWASKDGKYGYSLLSGTDDEGNASAEVVLEHADGDPLELDIDVTPPACGRIPAEASEEAIAANRERLAREDNIRTAYTSTFTNSSNVVGRIEGIGISDGDLVKEAGQQLIDAKGNWKEIRQFLVSSFGRGEGEKALEMLKTLSRKDLRDTKCDVLEDALRTASENADFCADSQTYFDYVLCPRISGEFIQPYHGEIRTVLDKALPSAAVSGQEADVDNAASAVIGWAEANIALADSLNARRLQATPAGVLKMRAADARSRSIFTIAALRTYGVPSRIDQMTGKAQYLSGNGWVDIMMDGNEGGAQAVASEKGTFTMRYVPCKGTLDNPEYYRHFTLSGLKNGRRSLLEFEGGDATELGADVSAKSFSKPFTLDAGTYLLTCGTRMASGKVLARVVAFNVRPDSNTDVELIMRQNVSDVSVIGSMDAWVDYETLEPDGKTGKSSIINITGRGYFLLAVMGDTDEPSNHAFREMQALGNELENWGRPVIIFGEDESRMENIIRHSSQITCSKKHFGIDNGNAVRNMLCDGCHSESSTLPVIAVCDSFGRVVYLSTGYNTSLATQLRGVIQNIR